MKTLTIFLFLLTLIFIYPLSKTYASDLNVECNIQTGCIILKNEPLFSNILDGTWYPGREVTKRISIKNSGAETREIRLKTKETSDGLLREVMYVTLSKSSGELIWQGKMKDFISQEYILGNHDSGEDKEFLLAINMEPTANNSYQNTDISFELALGFKEEAEADSENQSNGVDSGDGAESISNSVSVSSLAFLGSAFERVFGVLGDSEAQETTIAGEETKSDKGKDKKDVLGAGDNTCKENYLWIVFLTMQALFMILSFVPRLRKRSKLFLIGDTIIFASSLIAIYFLSCFLWPMLISAAIFILPLGFLTIKRYRSRLS